MDRIDIRIEDSAERLFIAALFAAHPLQCLLFDDEGDLQRCIMPPKRNVVMGFVIAADRIGKLKGHKPHLCYGISS